MRARGSWKARDREDEASFKGTYPEVPEWLRESARPFWQDSAKFLQGSGVVTEADGASLVMLAEAIDDYVNAPAEPKYQNQTRGACFDRLLKILREFGLTPASRANVKIDPKAKKTAQDKVKELLNVG